MENEIRVTFVVMVLTLVFFSLLEGARPRKPQSKQKLKSRWPINFALMLINQLNLIWVTAFSTVAVAWWMDETEIGWLAGLELGFWSATLLTCLTFELISYFYHRLLHTSPLLWRIHAVHHCDTEIDFSTTFRNHPFELLVVTPVVVPVAVLIGFPAASLVMYQILRTIILIFAHSNLHIPEQVDRYLRLLIITPDYHRVHHNINRYYTDSNFCPTFPVYDYLFGTAKKIPYKELPDTKLGLKYLRSPQEAGLIALLLTPFVWKMHLRRVAT